MLEPGPSVLYLSYDGLTDPLGQSQVLPYLIGLSKQGYQFTVISAEKEAAYAQRKKLIEDTAAAHGLDWQPIFYSKRPPVLSTLWDLRKMHRLAVRLHARKQFALVHCRSYLTALIGERLQRRHGIKFVFDMRGFWADERVEGGLWPKNHGLYGSVYRYFKRKETDFLRRADYTISLTHEAEKIIHRWAGLQHIPIEVIPCCVDTDVFRLPVAREVTPPEVPEGDQRQMPQPVSVPTPYLKSEVGGRAFTLVYLGSIGTWYLLDEMLQFFSRLLLHQPQATFLFITPDDPQVIRQRATHTGIDPDRLTIRQAERQEVAGWLAQCEYAIFFIKPCFSKKASSPTKMGEVLAMGLPVICNAGVGDTDYIVQQYDIGALVETLTDEAYERAIDQLDDLSQKSAAHFRRAALDYFDVQKGVNLYHRVYQRLLA